MSDNQLKTLPKEIGQLKNLQELYLSDNQLATLPKEIGQLKNLQELDLHNNQLATLPKEIGQLKNLQALGLINNQLSSKEKERIRKFLPKCKIPKKKKEFESFFQSAKFTLNKISFLKDRMS
ncbi:leucine rich repeat protein [Leptospira phage vB_LnoZ_CZ214-LE1]|nr:leucine rich repeat protein [Leptospira phage vB_LnoZ_CZ214-LE1]